MKLTNFIATVRKCVDVEVKGHLDHNKINDVILLSFAGLDDTTKVNLILAGLNDEHINKIMAKEESNETTAELEKVNQEELIKWRSWVMKTLIIFAGLVAISLIFVMSSGSSECENESNISLLFEIKKFIELVILNKTE